MKVFKQLNRKQRKEFIAGALKEQPEDLFSTWFANNSSNHRLVIHGLCWSESPQGAAYWNEIHLNLRYNESI